MIIDDKNFVLPNRNFVALETEKRQIVLGQTFIHDMRHFNGWLHRYNGDFKRTASFTISKNGAIHKHFDPKYCSRFFGVTELDTVSIVILLENDGWLNKDLIKNEFITWIGDIYSEPMKVVEKRWRGQQYWCPYTTKQVNSTLKLVKSLCKEFNIPNTVVSHNTKIDKLIDYKGVLYKSNLDKQFTDLNPSWDFELFKRKLENNEE